VYALLYGLQRCLWLLTTPAVMLSRILAAQAAWSTSRPKASPRRYGVEEGQKSTVRASHGLQNAFEASFVLVESHRSFHNSSPVLQRLVWAQFTQIKSYCECRRLHHRHQALETHSRSLLLSSGHLHSHLGYLVASLARCCT
jgi:hypothetical protein